MFLKKIKNCRDENQNAPKLQGRNVYLSHNKFVKFNGL